MKIEIIESVSGVDPKTHHGFSYRKGEIFDMPDAKAQKLIGLKWAKPVGETVPRKVIKEGQEDAKSEAPTPAEMASVAPPETAMPGRAQPRRR